MQQGSSLASDLGLLAVRFAHRTAVTDLHGAATFSDLFDRACALGQVLAGAGVGAGSRVVTLIENSADAVWVSWGILLAGGCEVTLNPMQSLAEQEWCMKLVNAVALVHSQSGQLPHSSAMAFDCRSIRLDDGIRKRFLGNSRALAADDDWGRILFTSGTTGRPKGVVHTHYGRRVAAMLLRQSITGRIQGRSTLLMTPFSHGASLLAYALLLDGAPVHLVPGVDPAVVAPLIRRGEIGHLFAPPTVLMKLVRMFRDETISTVKTIFTGTAPLSATLYAEARRIFGPCVRVTYGMTEIFNPITVLEPSQAEKLYHELGEAAVGMVGSPSPGVTISIRDDENRDVRPGEAGQVFIAARHMYAGYLREGEIFEPAPEFHPTGDIGMFHDVHGLRLLGRMHDTIKTGGYKVLPQEIEAALRAGGATGEIVVLGLPSEHWGEVIACARLAMNDNWFDDVRDAAAELSRYKQPRLLVTVPTVWKNMIGKVDRRRVREYILTHYQLVDGPYPVLKPRLPDAT